MTGLFETLKTVSNALQSVQKANFSTCTPDDKDLVSYEHVDCSNFPRITICLADTTQHYIGENMLTPPQLVLRPPSWEREGLRVVVVGTILGKKDTLCGPGEFALLFQAKIACIFKEKTLLNKFEL